MSDTISLSPVGAGRRRTAADAPAAPLLFDEAGVTVSDSRIVAYGTPFALHEGTGVRLFVDQRHLRFAIPILIAGLLLGAYGIVAQSSPALALAVMLVVVSFLTWRFQTMRHRLFVVRPTGDTEVLVGSDLAFMGRVKTALETALGSEATRMQSAVAPDAPPQASARPL